MASKQPPPPLKVKIIVVIKYADNQNGKYLITCPGGGGDHPRAAEACKRIQITPKAVWKHFPDTVKHDCVQVNLGKSTARVFGEINGKKVDAKFSQADGCEFSRWMALLPLFTPNRQ